MWKWSHPLTGKWGIKTASVKQEKEIIFNEIRFRFFFIYLFSPATLKHYWHHNWGTAKKIIFSSAVVAFSPSPGSFLKHILASDKSCSEKSACLFYLSLTLTSALGSLRQQNFPWSRLSSGPTWSFCMGREGRIFLCTYSQVLVLQTLWAS